MRKIRHFSFFFLCNFCSSRSFSFFLPYFLSFIFERFIFWFKSTISSSSFSTRFFEDIYTYCYHISKFRIMFVLQHYYISFLSQARLLFKDSPSPLCFYTFQNASKFYSLFRVYSHCGLLTMKIPLFIPHSKSWNYF